MTNKTFDSLGLSANTLKAVKNLDYSAPMPVQAEVIPLVLNGKDVLASAQTGSGKTAAFTIPLFNILLKNEEAKCLVVAPTRELAQQIQTVFRQLSEGSDIKNALIVGGKCIQGQLKKLKAEPRFIVGTPGRLNDHIKRKSLILDDAKYVVWDEMDRMLDLGFIYQIEHIMKNLPQERQTLMFSATFPKRVLKLAESYLKEPVRVIIDTLNSVSTDVQQEVVKIEGRGKLAELTIMLPNLEGQILVFAKTQQTVKEISVDIAKKGISAQALHGGLRQAKRDKVVKDFRENAFKVLVATDVAARGLDIPDIAYVINYELPQSPEEYIHRIGRTGRAGNKGKAISLVGRLDKSKWRQIQEFLKGQDVTPPNYDYAREQAMLKASREQGPFPMKKASKNKPESNRQDKPKARYTAGKKEEKTVISDKKKTTPAKTEKKVNVVKETVKPAKKQSSKQQYKEDKKQQERNPFKRSYVGKKKEEPKKYGNGPAKKWAKIFARKSKNKIPKKHRSRR